MRLPLHRASEPRESERHASTLHAHAHGRAVVVVVPLDDDATMTFVARCAETLVRLGAAPTLLLESDAIVAGPFPTKLRVEGATLVRAPTLTDSPSAAWNEALDPGQPVIAIGASLVPLLRANWVVAIGSGSLISARFRGVRSAIDAVLFESRPALADWLAGRLHRAPSSSTEQRISALVDPSSSG